MNQLRQIIGTSIVQALQEMRANKLRTFLSLMGITIGIFCIISVKTVLDSLKNNVQRDMATLGSNVLYVERWPWVDDGGEYKWWEYARRRCMTPTELNAVRSQAPDVDQATLCLIKRNLNVKFGEDEVTSVSGYAVMTDFDKLQNIEIQQGRYLSSAELDAGSNTVVLGSEIYKNLFPDKVDPLGMQVAFLGRKFAVVGVMKAVGSNMAGFDYDNSVVFPYYMAAEVLDTRSLATNTLLAVRAAQGKNVDDLKYEVEGVLRRVRKVRPGQADDFAINQLSQISEKLDSIFFFIDIGGAVIGIFALIVGGFGIANIMFVTVKERTKIIGLKKAIGARRASILWEFLLEAIVLCIFGGIMGIALVALVSELLTHVFDFDVTMSATNFTIGIFVSILVGVLSGIIPAWFAARLDPVVAIRTN